MHSSAKSSRRVGRLLQKAEELRVASGFPPGKPSVSANNQPSNEILGSTAPQRRPARCCTQVRSRASEVVLVLGSNDVRSRPELSGSQRTEEDSEVHSLERRHGFGRYQ